MLNIIKVHRCGACGRIDNEEYMHFIIDSETGAEEYQHAECWENQFSLADEGDVDALV